MQVYIHIHTRMYAILFFFTQIIANHIKGFVLLISLNIFWNEIKFGPRISWHSFHWEVGVLFPLSLNLGELVTTSTSHVWLKWRNVALSSQSEKAQQLPLVLLKCSLYGEASCHEKSLPILRPPFWKRYMQVQGWRVPEDCKSCESTYGIFRWKPQPTSDRNYKRDPKWELPSESFLNCWPTQLWTI